MNQLYRYQKRTNEIIDGIVLDKGYAQLQSLQGGTDSLFSV